MTLHPTLDSGVLVGSQSLGVAVYYLPTRSSVIACHRLVKTDLYGRTALISDLLFSSIIKSRDWVLGVLDPTHFIILQGYPLDRSFCEQQCATCSPEVQWLQTSDRSHKVLGCTFCSQKGVLIAYHTFSWPVHAFRLRGYWLACCSWDSIVLPGLPSPCSNCIRQLRWFAGMNALKDIRLWQYIMTSAPGF